MYRTIGDVQKAVLSGETVLSIAQAYLQRIEDHKHLNAFLEVFTESVLENAKKVDEKVKNGTAGKLAGVVIGIKDNICYKDHRVSASSKILEGFTSLYTATVLQRLIDQDAIVIGRLNCDEFAMGSSNETSAFGSVENNWKANHVPGGSSGGSAVAASANLCTITLGSDTGGSVRQPASWTGTYGLKPTYGRMSRNGLIAYASSFDQIGSFTNSAADAQLIYELSAGEDEMDATTSSKEVSNDKNAFPEKLKIGLISECVHHEGLDPEVRKNLSEVIQKLKDAGHEVTEVSFPFMDYMVPTYYVLTTAEASSNLSRFDGVHYGYRSQDAKGVEQTYVKSRTEGFGTEVKRRIMTGTFVLSHGYYDAYYTQGQKVRRVLKNRTDDFFKNLDLLLLPTTPGTAFEKNAVKDPIQMYLQDIFTVHANLTGNPAISIPFKVHSNGLPYGIQLMADCFQEDLLFHGVKKIGGATMRGILLVLLMLTGFSFSQKPAHLIRPADTLNPDAFFNTVQQSLNMFYAEYANQRNYDSIINSLNYEPNQVPTFSDEVYCERLEEMSKKSPFHMDCNQATLSTIKFFAAQRRGFIRVVMGRSALYFDLFGEKLSEYGLPQELRYLSVIESGLRPQVKSRAGALGLWQFMYKTGLYFGLEENSYIDERMDPEKATDAACRYLKQLYGIYGDWNLALAAYNAGPGNVNHAIKRSGGKTTYWEVRPFLPQETQGYVPNFIAAAYLITYHAEHNIVPMEAKVHNAQLDTMCMKSGVHMNTISQIASWDIEEIKSLNPVYKTAFIPKMTPARCLTGPMDKINLLVSLEDSLYSLEKFLYAPKPPVPKPVLVVPQDSSQNIDTVSLNTEVVDSLKPTNENLQYHKVKAGENLKNIALKYNVTIEQIMEWNGLQTTNIYVGQKLKLFSSQTVTPTPTPAPRPVQPAKKYYNVKPGDTFGKIAQRNNLSQGQLQRLNPGVNINNISVGQRIRIK